ncbi:MAG TPA: response regulator transcription factor [Anaerolineae bacterium]|nr:response regulator transcription factor [Anaerolineae bacterium]
MHILIADDEAPARGELRYILAELVPEAVFYEAASGEEALLWIERAPVEVVFLDIHMPGLDGLAVAAAIHDRPEPPLIVFATAYDEHALRAFELAALDYVVKPFDERRLARTVARVRRALAERAVLEQRRAALGDYLAQAAPAGRLTKLWGQRENESRVLVDYRDILWVEAEAKKVYVHTRSGERLRVRATLKELEPRLAPHGFVRVHKGYLVNLDHVAEVEPWFSGAYTIRMADAARTEIPVSRRYAARLKGITGWR